MADDVTVNTVSQLGERRNVRFRCLCLQQIEFPANVLCGHRNEPAEFLAWLTVELPCRL
ncbi:hypothetical protein AB0L99_19900 [Streptomyces sp. NPDC051954]|uniref:hypothetical protein n=1 Tax=unclassified Streptomyces TaxID=2593676 RepID=UPI00343EB9D0